MARKLLDSAWPAYPASIERIARGAPGMEPQPEAVLRRVVAELKPDRPVEVKVVVYAGMNDHNAFTSGAGPNKAAVALPADEAPALRGPVMAHEFTHAVQITQGALSGGWERSVGVTALSEGLAIRVAQKLYPDRPETEFVEYAPGWLERARARHTSILKDVRAAARASRSEDVMRFTIAEGPSGVDREAYYAGYVIVGHWLKKGRTPAEIARISEADAPAEIERAVDEMIGP